MINYRMLLKDMIIFSRKQKGFTQVQLADKAEVALTSLTNIEADNNAVAPRFDTVAKLAKVLEIDLNLLAEPYLNLDNQSKEVAA